MITLQQMVYILALYEEGQFQKASDKCFITQPTLSMQIKKAEEQLAQKIFDRNSNPLQLTTFGKEVVPIFQSIMNEYGRITSLKNEFAGLKNEQIRVGVIPTIGAYLIPNVFTLIKNEIPNAQIIFEELKSDELISSLEDYKLDLIIMAGPYFDVKYKTIKLFEEEIFIYCPDSNKDVLSLSDIEDLQPWLLSHGNCLRNQMIEFCQIVNKDKDPMLNYKGGNFEVLMKMVELHGGYTLLPEFVPINATQKKGLKKLFSGSLNPGREIIACYANRSHKTEYLKKIVSLIKSNFSLERTGNLEIIAWK